MTPKPQATQEKPCTDIHFVEGKCSQWKKRVEALNPEYFIDKLTWEHDVKNTVDMIEEEIALAIATRDAHHKALRAKELGEVLEMVKDTDLAIRKADKTPKYEYSHSRCDANRDGEFPDAGQRWAMPWELSNTLVRRIKAKLDELIEKRICPNGYHRNGDPKCKCDQKP